MDTLQSAMARQAADEAQERSAYRTTTEVLPEIAALLREICDRLAAIEAVLVESKPQG